MIHISIDNSIDASNKHVLVLNWFSKLALHLEELVLPGNFALTFSKHVSSFAPSKHFEEF
jgi:hypothetical protein